MATDIILGKTERTLTVSPSAFSFPGERPTNAELAKRLAAVETTVAELKAATPPPAPLPAGIEPSATGANAEASGDGWISVGDEAPKRQHDLVWAFYPSQIGGRNVFILRYACDLQGAHWTTVSGKATDAPTHWQPLTPPAAPVNAMASATTTKQEG